MSVRRVLFAFVLFSAVAAFCQSNEAPNAAPAPADSSPAGTASTLDQVVQRVVARERQLVNNMTHFSPVVETYIQNMREDKELGAAPESDRYFLGRLDLMNSGEQSFLVKPGVLKRLFSGVKHTNSLDFNALGFSWMIFADRDDFDREHYDFSYVRREFLGDIRCLVLDVVPKKGAGKGRFQGRIWVEDQDYNIVRLNGTYVDPGHNQYYFHFDSWRVNLQPGLWLPAFIYSQENDLHYGLGKGITFKAQTRLWGYNLKHASHESELTDMVVDSPAVKDQSEAAQDATPIQSARLWEQQAESNVVDRLQHAGLLDPPGDLDKVLETVLNNLIVTNNIDLPWPVHCRVMLTAPLETFHVGHTIIVSRGLLDVLPDEVSLAMVLSHELGHIVLGHMEDSKFAFNDRMLFSDNAAYQNFGFSFTGQEEQAADQKAMAFLRNSPYKDKLGAAGLFLKALQSRSAQLTALTTPHLGNPLAVRERILRLPELMNGAPQLEATKLDQIPALPLGGRVKVDPWSDRAELIKAPAVPLASAREKLMFEVTPVFPHLARLNSEGNVTAQSATPQPAPAPAAAQPSESKPQ